MSNDTQQKPPLRAVPMSLFPTFSSLEEVLELAESQLPITNSNDMLVLLMMYHNTLLKVLENGNS